LSREAHCGYIDATAKKVVELTGPQPSYWKETHKIMGFPEFGGGSNLWQTECEFDTLFFGSRQSVKVWIPDDIFNHHLQKGTFNESK
jgi:hypothetical protein